MGATRDHASGRVSVKLVTFIEARSISRCGVQTIGIPTHTKSHTMATSAAECHSTYGDIVRKTQWCESDYSGRKMTSSGKSDAVVSWSFALLHDCSLDTIQTSLLFIMRYFFSLGAIMSSGLTYLSKSSSLSALSSIALSLSVKPFLWAFFATLLAMS